MSINKTVRTGLLGSAAVVALLAVSPAQAVEAQFGDVSITFDTTVSMGASMLTQEREAKFLSESNGGPVDPRADVSLGAVVIPGLSAARTSLAGVAIGSGFNAYTANGGNFDGLLNNDDGRLNFNRGDLVSANVKATHDLQISWQNYKIFARGVGFYDVIMNDKNAGERSQLTDQALGDVGRNYELLDAFVSADYTLGDLPLNLRVGKQVINWGESTFIQNGLNAFNPIDVAAIRRPGSEIKEALVPVNAVFGSISFPFQVSMSGWYALDWEPVELDPSGTAFSTADSIASGSGIGGNNSYSFVTSSPFGANRRNCLPGSATAAIQIDANPLLPGNQPLLNNPNAAGINGDGLLQCSDSPYVSDLARLPNGQHELIRLGQIDGTGVPWDLSGDGVTKKTTGILARGEDYQARDTGQFGVKATWFSEDLNGTEFALYYQNYHSRLPFAGIESVPGSNTADLGFTLQGANTELATGVSSRALPLIGCGLANSGNPLIDGSAQIAGSVKPGATVNSTVATLTSFGTLAALVPGAAATKMKATNVNDPGGLMSIAAASIATWTGGPTLDASNGFKNQYAVMQLNCVLGYFQSTGVALPGLPPGVTIAQPFDHGEYVLGSKGAQVSVYYPEDIEVFGFSFNTTIGSWGVQAETSYRPRAPFQVDTDSLTINALSSGCIFEQLRGWAGSRVIQPLNTPDGSGVKGACGDAGTASNPVVYNEMFTAQIGTTSQMTGSDWFIDMIGADIGTFVTEVGMVYTPSVEDSWIDNMSAADKAANKWKTQYQNTGCQGTDLPLGSILDLDIKNSQQCRPTDLSAGLVMLFTVQYNNFLDSGFAVSPRVVYSYDFEGTTAAPYGNYMEDRQALNLGVDGTLNNNFKVGMSYSNFFGGHVNNKSRDRDFASFSASYSF